MFGQPQNINLKPITVDQYQVGLHVRSTNNSRLSFVVYRKIRRGPDYFRLDVRYEMDFTLFQHPFDVYVGLDNATNRKNYYQHAFIPHCGTVCTALYELTQQGFLVEGGVTYRF